MLAKGDEGPEVKALQQKLLQMGYPLPQYGDDGDYGDETEAAVTLFKTDLRRMLDAAGVTDGLELVIDALTAGKWTRPQSQRAGGPGWQSFRGGKAWRVDSLSGKVEVEGEGIPINLITPRKIINKYRQYIQPVSAQLDIPPELIVATICTESSGNERDYLYEPNFYRRYLLNKSPWVDNPYYNEPERISASYGLMQIMYPVAYELGYRGTPEELYDVATNLEWGAKEIDSKRARSKLDPVKVAAIYNAGGLYYSDANAWHLRTTGNHLDRFVKYYNGAMELWEMTS